MNNKGFADNQSSIETPNDVGMTEKPLNSKQIKSERVDINILRSKLEEQQAREFRKNLTIFTFCILLLGAIGIYLSL